MALPAASRNRHLGQKAPGSGATSLVRASLSGVAQGVRVAGREAAEGGPAISLVLRGIPGDHRLAADSRLGERVAERFQASGKVDRPAARPDLAQIRAGPSRPRNSIRGSDSSQVRKVTRRLGCHPHPDRDSPQSSTRGEEFREPLVHLLVGREQDRAQDGWIARHRRDGVGGDRMRAHHEPVPSRGQRRG